ncbi:MAG: hypothetical protein P0111_10185 [Nitrospira sp.]|nr:hypothetical protein [Nitrospira sp.]
MSERVIEGLPDDTQRIVQSYAKDVKQAFGERVEGLLIYGSAVRGEFLPGRSNLNMLLLMTSYDAAMLRAYAPLHKRWSKEQIVVPLFLAEQELNGLSALFPLEFLEIQDCHRVLGGRDPFVGYHINRDRLGDQVLQGFVGHVLRLRQRFAEAGGADDAVTILLPLSVTSVIPLLRGLQRLLNRPVSTHSDAAISDMAEHFKIDLQGLRDALALKRGQITPGRSEVPRLFDRYLHAVSILSATALTLR